MKFSIEELFDLALADGGIHKAASTNEAYAFCRKLALGHYENFPVGSFLLPADKRPHIFAVYAFARIADDIADELFDTDISERISALNKMGDLVKSGTLPAENTGNPVFLALRNTIEKMEIPVKPLLKLLEAFKRDIHFTRPGSFADLEDYCSYSANPVGELVLRIFGQYNDTNSFLSDKICTGLQLVNFWQDLSIDIKRGRCYLPDDIMEKHGINQENLQVDKNSIKLLRCLNDTYEITGEYFNTGKDLPGLLKPLRLRAEIAATIEGGRYVLAKTQELGSKVLFTRPKLTKADYLSILFRSIKSINWL